MSLEREVEALMNDQRYVRSIDPEVARLIDLLRELQEQGIVKKPGYDLPLRDTVGRSLAEHPRTRERMTTRTGSNG